jgi:hypothetical protein
MFCDYENRSNVYYSVARVCHLLINIKKHLEYLSCIELLQRAKLFEFNFNLIQTMASVTICLPEFNIIDHNR